VQYTDFRAKLSAISSRLDAILAMDLPLDARERLSITNLSQYVGGTLARVHAQGQRLTQEDIMLVEQLDLALSIIVRDGVVKLAEVSRLVKIADDLAITEEELKQLEKDGENG